MHQTRTAAFCAFACLLGGFAGVVQAGALLDVYQQAQQGDQTLIAAGFQRDAASEARPQAMAALLPQVGAQGSYAVQDNKSSSSTARFGAPVPTTLTQKTNSEDRTLSLSLSQALFDWGAFTRLRQSDAQVALAETGYRAAQQDLIYRVAEAYFNVLTASETLRAATAQTDAISRQLEQSRQRFEVGLSAITDVQDAQARHDLSVAQQLQAETALASSQRALAQITGAADNKVAPLREDLPLAGPDPHESAAWTEAARQNNLAVVAAMLNSSVAESEVKIARAQHLPTLSLQGGYSDSRGNIKVNGNRSPNSSEGTQVEALLNVPIFAGGAIQSAVRAANATLSQRHAEQETAVRTAVRNAGDAYQGVLTGISTVKAYQAAVTSTRTALEASQMGLQVGTRTAIDVLNAQQQLYAAESNYAKARHDYLLSVLLLKQSAGRLGEADLAEVDRLLVIQ